MIFFFPPEHWTQNTTLHQNHITIRRWVSVMCAFKPMNTIKCSSPMTTFSNWIFWFSVLLYSKFQQNYIQLKLCAVQCALCYTFTFAFLTVLKCLFSVGKQKEWQCPCELRNEEIRMRIKQSSLRKIESSNKPRVGAVGLHSSAFRGFFFWMYSGHFSYSFSWNHQKYQNYVQLHS